MPVVLADTYRSILIKGGSYLSFLSYQCSLNNAQNGKEDLSEEDLLAEWDD